MAPLTGKRVLVTRAEGQADELARELAALGAEAVCIPLIAFADPPSWDEVDAAVAALERYRALVFTSANAVARFWTRVEKRVGSCDDPALPASLAVFAVGPRTKTALAERGIAVASVPEEHRGEAIAAEMIRELGTLNGARVLLPRAEQGAEELPEKIRAAGGTCDLVTVYRTVMPQAAGEQVRAELAKSPKLHAVTLASGSAAENLAAALGGGSRAREALAGVILAAIGPATAAKIRELGLGEPRVAARATPADLAEALR